MRAGDASIARVDHRHLLARALGAWSLARVIEGEGATMSGRATFTADPDGGVLYQEEGEMRWRGGATTRAHRRYRFAAAPAALLIDFADGAEAGRRFVELAFAERAGALVAQATHPCGADRYDVACRIEPRDRFASDILVSGPRKAYRIVTEFTRAPA